MPDAPAAGSIVALSAGLGRYWTVDADGSAVLNVEPHNATPTFQTAFGQVQAVAAGTYSSYEQNTDVFLRKDGTVWTEGAGASGQLGDGTQGPGRYASTPVQVVGLTDVVQVANGGNTNFALRSDGTVWGWGSGYPGALANDSEAIQPVPVQISGLSNVVWLTGFAAGDGYAVESDGSVWVWGCGANGAHGNGTNNDQADYSVQRIPGLPAISRVYATWDGVISAIDAKGEVWAWGIDSGNATGTDPSGTDAQQVNAPPVVESPRLVPGVSSAVAVGDALIVRSDGRIYTWAYDEGGGAKSTIPPALAPAPSRGMLVSVGYVFATNPRTI